jgi:hypothetical protein
MSLLDTINVSSLGFQIDHDHYGLAVRPGNKYHHTEKVINGYIVRTIRNYATNHYESEDLWSAFHDDFEVLP